MFDITTIPVQERERITRNLLRWGVVIDQENGKIDYNGAAFPEMKCESIHLIRHAETIAVVNHEFMSDTSANSALSEAGIKTTKKQACELDGYNFDIALFGIIPRVIATKDIIMSVPQKFEAVRFESLHGISNAGWEYKSFFDMEHDPVFVAREVENNMFARSPKGTSWGTVIANCADTLEYINECYAGKRILLISQGSILRGFQILLHTRKHPWDDYSVSGMYHVGDDSKYKKNYGIISQVY